MKFTLKQRLPLMIIVLTFLALTFWANTPSSITLGLFTSKRTTTIDIAPLHDTRFFEASATPPITVEEVGLPRTFMRRHSRASRMQGWQINYWALLQNILFALAVQISLYFLAMLVIQPRLIHIFLLTFGIAALTVAAQRMTHLPNGVAAYYVLMTVLITPMVLAILLWMTSARRNRQNHGMHAESPS